MAAKVKVVARLRPFLSNECSGDGVIVSPQEGTISVLNPRVSTERYKFHFTSCYDQTSTQEDIFSNEVRPLINYVYEGLVCTVFAYGVTSSGKTHTIQGTPEQPGIIPRVVNALLERKREMSRKTVTLSLSYMELYKDEPVDLLVPRDTTSKLFIREDSNGKIFVTNLTEKPISSLQDFEKLFSIACKGRSTGATTLNHASSRSHAMLSLTVSCLDPLTQKALCGKINLVDLAGSENNKMTGNDPARMAESAAINKSLTVLGQVVHALNTNASRVPYRDSKLTRILQDALGGSSMGLLICNIAPTAKLRQDTLNTLNFATRTKQVENKVTINEKDMRPSAKPHFSAHAPTSLNSRPALLPAASDRPRASLGGPSNYNPPAIHPLNGFGFTGFTHGGRSSLPGREKVSEMGVKEQVLEMDLDERISKAVQQEVERRMAEREAQERERLKEIEEQEREKAAERQRQDDEQRAALMRKHDELNRLLKKTLRKAEKENHIILDGNEETTAALSPKKAKRLAAAYVTLGREYLQSKEPDYNAALKLWQQAETYIPDNKALKKRITELEIAIREGVAYRVPKRPRGGNTLLIESPVPNSPSGSRDHKESRKRRLRARIAKMKERGDLDSAMMCTPTPKKDKKDTKKQQQDVFADSDEEMLDPEVNAVEALGIGN